MDQAWSEFFLPVWDESYAQSELRGLLERYGDVDEERMWENFESFSLQYWNPKDNQSFSHYFMVK